MLDFLLDYGILYLSIPLVWLFLYLDLREHRGTLGKTAIRFNRCLVFSFMIVSLGTLGAIIYAITP